MSNTDIRSANKAKKVPLWKVAGYLGISEATMTRKLRHELPPAEKEKILAIIDELAKEAS